MNSRLISGLTISLFACTQGDIVINEIHYDAEPSTEFVEFLEIYNNGDTVTALDQWQFSEGISLIFPESTSLESGNYLLVAEDPAALRAKFANIPGNVPILQYTGNLSSGEEITLINPQGVIVDRVDYQVEFPWPISPDGEGDSMQLLNDTLDNDLGGAWRGATPTPGLQNGIYSAATPPMIRQVDHSPKTPLSSEAAVITCKVTDTSGVSSVQLRYQIVSPGDYIPAFLPHPYGTLVGNPSLPLVPNPAFENPANWTTITMADDGSGADLVANDDIFTAEIPAQDNRTLVRYRIIATDDGGTSVQVPHTDDRSLNFAYFVYNGIPAWTAQNSLHSPNGGTHTYSPETLQKLEVYSMITRDSDRSDAFAYASTGDRNQQIPKSNAARSVYNWECAFIYDGIVYDHVGYRLRQNNDRYFGNGKRSMRFNFNRGHYFQARDEEGKKLPLKWKKMNNWKMAPFGGLSRFGIDQTMNYRLWRMVGVECPRFQHIHFRVIDQSEEAPDQFGGDFFGLANFHQNIDNRLIEDIGIEGGNVYKLKDGSTNALQLQRAQARNAVSDGSDFTTIRTSLNPNRNDSWLWEHVDWDQWYRYHAVTEAIRHYDFGATNTHFKNRGWHFKPSPGSPLGLLRIVPHDHNGSWYNGYHDNQNSSGTSIGTDYPWWAIFGDRDRPPVGAEKTAFTLEYRNFVRDFRQLLWQEETVNTMMNDMVASIREFSYADRDRWTGGPVSAGREVTDDIDNVIAPMQEFAFVSDTYLGATLSGGRGKFLDDLAADPAIPDTPTISYSGAVGFPNDSLEFTSSSFSDPQGAGTFSKMRWRIAEISDYSLIASPPFIASGDLWNFFDQGTDPGVDWNTLSFDDSSWSSGESQLGWGEADQATNVPGRSIATFFRRSFSVADPSIFEGLTGGVIRDDGVVIYLNGQEIFRNQMPDGEITFNTISSSSASGDNEKKFQPFSAPTNLLVAGENIIAVSIHQHTPNSGDMSFDLFLNGITPAPERRFEWNASWESGDLDTFNTAIIPPASATRAGFTYRARVQHADSSGRWSQWSDPLEFTPSEPDLSLFQNGLVISEVMYHSTTPSEAEIAEGFIDDDFFDFIEIRNISDATIDLTNVRLTKGVNFDFANGLITQLAPGELLLVVHHRAAFEMRYGMGLPIAGEWEGRLKNNSELIKLSFGAGELIKEFTYQDLNPWPIPADGSGSSLALIDPLSNPTHDQAFSWRPAAATPGQTGTTTFAGGTNEEFLNYATLNDSPTLQRLENDFLEFTITLNLAAEDINGTLQSCSDLFNWNGVDANFQIVQFTDLQAGYARVTFRSLVAHNEEELFFRYLIQKR